MDPDKAALISVQNVLKEGLTDIFPAPAEVLLLKNEAFRSFLCEQVVARLKSNSLSGLKVFPISHVLFPKKEAYDFRRAALIQPIDTITYLTLVLQYARIIEENRIAKRRNVVFSYRFKPKDGYLFDPKFNFTAFQSFVLERTKSSRVRVLVKADVSNYYDRLNLHRLESTLLSLPIPKSLVKLTNELLLFWASRDSYSLPIGGNASRILAEAALVSVDDYLLSVGVKYCRYVDDFRLFAPDAKTAHAWLTILVERLYLEGLTVNPSKTVIEDVSARKKDQAPEQPEAHPVRDNSQPRIIVGYTGTIPTKFRELSEREVEELKKDDITPFEDSIRKREILHPDSVKKFLRIIVANGDYSRLALFKDVVEKFPQFTPLLVDLLMRKEGLISAEIKESVRAYFSEILTQNTRLPEYILIATVRLLGSAGYSNPPILMEFFRNLKRNAGAYIGRAVLDALESNVSRTDVLEIRQYFPRADAWERRAIIRIVNNALSDEEKRPWLKNVKIHSADDFFAIESFDPKKK